VAAGWQAHCLYGTTFRSWRVYDGVSEREVRSAEAIAACKVLGASWEFLEYEHEQIDTSVEGRRLIVQIIGGHKPDIVVAHWPVDTHPDHRVVGILALDAYLANKSYAFYFFEVMTGRQSLRFTPTHYVDISSVAETKRTALLCHKSQEPEKVWEDHEVMHRFRGRECGVERAEAYVRVDRGAGKSLPGLAL